jgi:diguanylate cyclase (GGDEF)-like protein
LVPRQQIIKPTRSAEIHSDTNTTVAIYADARDHEKLGAALSPLPISIVHRTEFDQSAWAADGPPAAAIVADSVDRPLDLCSRFSRDCPTILLTGHSEFEFRLAAARAEVGALLFRPLDSNELVDWLEHLIGQRRNTPFTILVLDDDLLLAEVYAIALRGAGMHVHVVSTATEAFEWLAARLPDLILMDVQMPGASGIEIARIIRQSRRYLSVPIVFVSGERDFDRQIEARRFGGDEFVTKPVDPQHLVALVRLRAERAHLISSIIERDSLTGLLNHSRFKERLAHELERCRRTGAEVSFAMIDLDRFKRVNDTYGHLMGDRVIRALSNTLNSGMRRIDIIGRYGGEEFGAIMLDTPPDAARIAIEKQRQRFSDIRFEASGQHFQASFSAGIAGSAANSSVEAIIAAADAALYAAKQGGRNKVVVSAPKTEKALRPS